MNIDFNKCVVFFMWMALLLSATLGPTEESSSEWKHQGQLTQSATTQLEYGLIDGK